MVEVSFASHFDAIRVETPGARLQMGPIDPAAGPGRELTPEEAATRTWKPDEPTWEKIKRLSVKLPARITITGFAEGNSTAPVSSASVAISDLAGPGRRTPVLSRCSSPAAVPG